MMWFEPRPFVLGGSAQAHLKVQSLSAGYGAFLVLRDLRLEIKPGLTVILGPNGAGKTTLLKALSGLIPRQGQVLLIRRAHAPGRGLLALPGGFLEPHDTLWQSCLRELSEETHCDLPPEALAQAIRRLLDDPAWARDLADAARSVALDRFTAAANVASFESLYDRVLAARRKA